MKTTIQIPDSLFEEARELAHREQTTMKALVEEGLRRIVAEHQRRRPFRLQDGSFGGNGLHADFAGASWQEIREAIYEGRGG